MSSLENYLCPECEGTDVPDLVTGTPDVSYYEYWPAWLFYLPLKIYGIYLGLRFGSFTLPTISNPSFDQGGFVGESKSQIMDLVPDEIKEHFAVHTTILRSGLDELSIKRDLEQAKANMAAENIAFPCVAKPDIGARGAGVQRVYNDEELVNYIRQFPLGEKIILQAMFDYPNEAGLFYIRKPGEEKGKIFSLTLKFFPRVTGDGTSTLRELIKNDPRAGKIAHLYFERHKEHLDVVLRKGQIYKIAFAGSHSRGIIFKDANHLITPKMEETWDRISKGVPEFYFGRYDIRFNNMVDLEQALDAKIIEINGGGAEATHVWDSKTPILKAYKTLAEQYRLLCEIGHLNRKRGYKPEKFMDVVKLIRKDAELTINYPTTH